MASLEINFGEDFLSELLEADVDGLCMEMLEESAGILEKALKEETAKVIKHSGESELVESVHAGKAGRTKNGAHIVNVRFTGYSSTKRYTAASGKKRKYPVSNALKAIWKEYGIPGRQAATPFINTAVRRSGPKVSAKLQEVYNRRTGIT